MKHATSRSLAVFLVLSLALGALCGVPLLPLLSRRAENAARPAGAQGAPVVVIDPGHGGEDGGAVADDGVCEKDLNLALARTVAALLRAAGFDARMTRTDDRLLYDLYGERDVSGRKKTLDLYNRLRFADEADAALLVSIHMNRFPQPQVRGLQVYYGPAAPESRAVAERIQNCARTYLEPQNRREIKEASSSIYLLYRAARPAVLVECGFLSNPEDLAALEDPARRCAIALVIASAIAESLGGTA